MSKGHGNPLPDDDARWSAWHRPDRKAGEPILVQRMNEETDTDKLKRVEQLLHDALRILKTVKR